MNGSQILTAVWRRSISNRVLLVVKTKRKMALRSRRRHKRQNVKGFLNSDFEIARKITTREVP
jgi:hypothetical protein